MTGSELSQPAATSPAPVSIVPEIPVVFADAATSHSHGRAVSKIYFSRYDPDPASVRRPAEKVLLQVVIPNDSFLRMAAFFEHRIKVMIADKAVTQEQWDKARQFWIEYKAPTA